MNASSENISSLFTDSAFVAFCETLREAHVSDDHTENPERTCVDPMFGVVFSVFDFATVNESVKDSFIKLN